MTKAADTRVQLNLQEAMREIQIIAGLDRSKERNGLNPTGFAIGVTSADYGDGKTTTAIALASSMSSDLGINVTLVDLDFQTCSIGREYGLDRNAGVIEVLSGAQDLGSVVHRTGTAGLSVVSAGMTRFDTARVARSDRMADLVDEMKAMSPYVICDLPAALHSMTAPVLAQRCDAVVVVARAGHTSRADLERVLHLLKDANVIGVILNRYKSYVPEWLQRSLGFGE